MRHLLRGKPSSNNISKAKGVKRETAPSSESAQFILAWRSEDSGESAKSSQSEAQPGIGCNAIPEAAQRAAAAKSPARGQYPKIRKTSVEGSI